MLLPAMSDMPASNRDMQKIVQGTYTINLTTIHLVCVFARLCGSSVWDVCWALDSFGLEAPLALGYSIFATYAA